MATFTITTPVNIDTLAGKAGADTYNINGGYLTIDQHSRYGVNQSTSASLGNMTLSSSLGGTVEINSTKVRLIPFDSGSSTVPALDTTISQGSASGKLLGVYSDLTSAPTTAGAAMPTSGYILIRQWNEESFAAGSLTGISATATDVDRAGWLEIVGTDALTVTIYRLNKFLVYGDYWDFLGTTTTGTRTDGYQLPTNGSSIWVPGVEVETDVAGVYEFYPNAGSQTATAAKIATDAIRGRWCWVTTSGLIYFGYDGTNSDGGYCPPSGRKIRIPNIFFQCAAAGSPTANVTPNATLASRYEFATTGGAYIDINNASMNWYMNFSQAYYVNLQNVFTFDTLVFSECASAIDWNNVGVGQSAGLSNYGFNSNTNFAGGTFTKCVFTRCVLSSSNNYVATMTYYKDFTFNQCRFHQIYGNRGNASTGMITMTTSSGCVFNECILGGGKTLIATSNNFQFNNNTYYDHPATTTPSTNPCYVNEFTTCSNMLIDGLNFGGLTLCQPYNGIFTATTFSDHITCRNLGTYAEPLDLGDVRRDDVAWSRSAAVATVTSTAHGLKTGDKIYVVISSATGAISVASKTLTGTPTADTFTFACTNASSTSGTLSYFPTMSTYVFTAATAANNILVQRCFCPHTITNLFTADNSVKNLRIENVISDYLNVFLTAALNLSIKSVSGSPSLAAQTSVYGTHRIDAFNADVTTNLTDLTWSRSSTTCTVTCADHKLRTGLLINVTTSSDKSAVPLGTKTVTVINSSTFTFTCLNAGGTSGTLDMRTVIDKIALLMNEPTADTVDQISNMVGTAAFTSAGGLVMPTVDDSVTFESPTYRYGFTGFPAAQVVMGGATITNFRIQYQIDLNDGGGYGDWHNMYYRKASGASGGGAGTYTFTHSDPSGLEVGDYVSGTGIGGLAKITDITGTTITVDEPNTAAVSGALIFYAHQRNEVLTDSGFKFKVKITTTTATTTAITSLSIYADSDDTSRQRLYPLDTYPLTVTTVNPDLETLENVYVRVVAAETAGGWTVGDVMMKGLTNSSGVITDNIEASSDVAITIRARRATVEYGDLYQSTDIPATFVNGIGLETSIVMIKDE